MKRTFDIVLSFILMLFFFIPALTIAIVIKLTSEGQVIYWSKRVGKNNIIFNMPKFRTMKNDTPELASHLLQNSDTTLTSIGGYLRKYSLDELPQLWSIFFGKMSFVGPRPALFNQNDLIDLRIAHGVEKLKPGLTGWAQVNGRDDLTIADKVSKDLEYLKRYSFVFDLKILWLTIHRVIKKDGISH
jgi:O-antigen biosynthesis protein WbqP